MATKIDDVLETITKKIAGIPYAFIGSVNLYIQFDESEGRNSFRSFYNVGGEIEVLGNVNNLYRQPDALSKRIYIQFGAQQLPCMPLIDEKRTCEKLGRTDKVHLIQRFFDDL
jgi:hypothetical protein